jgi:hypothetical protein
MPFPLPWPIYSSAEKNRAMCGADLSNIDEERSDLDDGDLKKRKKDHERALARNGA